MNGSWSNQLEDALYFSLIKQFIDSELEQYAHNLLDRIGDLMLTIALPLLSLWIMWRGWEIVSARQREPMMAQVVDLLRVSVVVMLASTAALNHDSLYRVLTDGISNATVSLVSGKPAGALLNDIDRGFAVMDLAYSRLQQIDTGDDIQASNQRDKSSELASLGAASPAVVGSAMMVLNRFMLAILLGLGPFFVLCLVFKQGEGLFRGWLSALVACQVSLAVLSVAISLAMDLVVAMGATLWLSDTLLADGLGVDAGGIYNMARLQAATGLILSTLILGAPPAAAGLFRSAVANFNPYSPFNKGSEMAPANRGKAS
ncbi:type IV secretion system protein [Stenotrophomonas sp. W1S232]|jgi:Type IV secretory pathway, VirB6 components|uniref:Type IV secretion system protein n=1 Tax=Stenotrophomonas koreensis TaxID=266128 RepID=A0A7W3YV20_9GAMM|nr:type IV secretion system protein [Stenotrophomonas koreensis]MBB1117586.1 type IV secretion system protein [Stenotrophomonas koreensis]